MQSNINSILNVIAKWLCRATYLLLGFIIVYGFLNQFLLPEDIRDWTQIVVIIIVTGLLMVGNFFLSKSKLNPTNIIVVS